MRNLNPEALNQKQVVSRTWINNRMQQSSVWCNYLYMSCIPAYLLLAPKSTRWFIVFFFFVVVVFLFYFLFFFLFFSRCRLCAWFTVTICSDIFSIINWQEGFFYFDIHHFFLIKTNLFFTWTAHDDLLSGQKRLFIFHVIFCSWNINDGCCTVLFLWQWHLVFRFVLAEKIYIRQRHALVLTLNPRSYWLEFPLMLKWEYSRIINSLWPSDAILWQIWVNIGSGNGLLPDGTKPLPEPMFTDHQWSPVTFILGQFHMRCFNHQSLKSVWKLHV